MLWFYISGLSIPIGADEREEEVIGQLCRKSQRVSAMGFADRSFGQLAPRQRNTERVKHGTRGAITLPSPPATLSTFSTWARRNTGLQGTSAAPF